MKPRMLKTVSTIAVAGLLAASLGACAQNGYGDKQVGGTVIGGALGGLLGSTIGGGKGQLAATAAGALLGALAGSEAGKSMDRADRLYAARTQHTALESAPVGTTTRWVNPDTGHSGSVTPTRTYQVAGGQYCREYQQVVTVGGQAQSAYGKACRQPDGSWQVVN
jgi:surface antigen